MDSKSVENTMKKLLDWVKTTADSDSKVYDKTKQRLKNISEICIQMVNVISNVLQTEVKQLKSNEVELTQNVDFQNQLDFLTNEIEKIKVFVKYETPNQLDISYSDKQELIANSGKNPTSADKKFIVKKYGQILQEVSEIDCGVVAANQCADILWRWFKARIFTKYSNAPTFNYNVCRIKDIIYSLVIAFGYYFEKDKKEKFVKNFDEWAESLSISQDSNKWIAPFEVYKIEKSMDEKYANLTAIVIFDVLWENGFSALCDVGKQYNSDLSDNEIYEKIANANSEVLDPYVNYTVDQSILTTLNLI